MGPRQPRHRPGHHHLELHRQRYGAAGHHRERPRPNGNYLTTQTIDDSLGNVREVQTETASGGTDVTDTSYDSDGGRHWTPAPLRLRPPDRHTVEAASSSIPDQTGYAYDGDGRVIRQTSYTDGTETWETDTAYGGNYTTITPPPGGTPQTTWTDGRGLTTAIWQYHAGAPAPATDPASDYDATTYTYTPGQQLATITDAGGNAWSYTYDLLGDQLTQSDPDAGTTTSTYDAAQQLMTVTDARGKTIAYSYDADSRKTAEYDTTGGAPENSSDELASWTYDTLAKGQLTSSTAYAGGSAYTEAVTGYNSQELPSGTETIIPAAQGALAGTYTQAYTYAPDGQATSYTDSACGGLPAETVTIGYNSAGEEDSLTGASQYVDALSYTDLGQPLQYTMGASSEPVDVTDSYDPQTGNITRQNTQAGTAQTQVDDLNYTYNDIGDITSEADTPAGDPAATDVQCFRYDYLNRLVQAWSQGSAGCVTSPSASAEGGAAPDWSPAATTPSVTSPASPAQLPPRGHHHHRHLPGRRGRAPARRHRPDRDSSVRSGQHQQRRLRRRREPHQRHRHHPGPEALTWNDAGQLSQAAVTPSGTTTAQDTTYIYDADGTLLLTADPGTTTLYLPDEELSLNASTGTVTGTRYYTIGGVTAAALPVPPASDLIGDQQGTGSLAINGATLALTRRYYDPDGNPIGTTPASFPAGEKGFVGGKDDPATSLTDLGAREYQPATESFISAELV